MLLSAPTLPALLCSRGDQGFQGDPPSALSGSTSSTPPLRGLRCPCNSGLAGQGITVPPEWSGHNVWPAVAAQCRTPIQYLCGAGRCEGPHCSGESRTQKETKDSEAEGQRARAPKTQHLCRGTATGREDTGREATGWALPLQRDHPGLSGSTHGRLALSQARVWFLPLALQEAGGDPVWGSAPWPAPRPPRILVSGAVLVSL